MDDESCYGDGGKLTRGVYGCWDRDLGGGVRGTGAGASSTDVNAGECDEDEDTEEATHKRKFADNKGREWGVAERPQAEHTKDKQVEKGKAREDEGEWLIIVLCNNNGIFLFYFPHRNVTSTSEPNRIIRF